MEEKFFEVINQDSDGWEEYLRVLNVILNYSGGADPVYVQESFEGTFLFFSNIPITDERIAQWHKEEEEPSPADEQRRENQSRGLTALD